MLTCTISKRSLRRLCFHRCLSVHGGLSAPLHAGIHPPRTRGRHPPRADPLGRHTPSPLGRHPLGRHPPGRHPPSRHPLCAVHAGILSTSGRYESHWNAFLFNRFTVSATAASDNPTQMEIQSLQFRDCVTFHSLSIFMCCQLCNPG